ncbi:5-formyltetrahydrofolate cyclo-ligase [Treponema maltophilum ATCC 51939]|uniref:5-formyltetrahydrofolate cyclo-ligase n=1 Tax=Treponema maltophilum ATCC 51939 TaxID=1125699 RepID=S3JYC9_TREMA|nr:5-formyltetrahydrofolate cyclo-ligase [Treponema maltophilum]EPF30220.1 5-formyltetrahydrofolate cyclo-ligase [Treponema maltophilum ATCC 51939]
MSSREIPNMTVREQKAALRRSVIELLHQTQAEEFPSSFFRSLRDFAPYRNAKSVLLYASLPYEAPTRGLIDFCLKDGKTTALPKTQKRKHADEGGIMDFYILSPDRPFREQTQIGPFGIAEPDSSCPLFVPDENRFPLLVCVPGIAFSETGIRLGRGAGYYDRYCERLTAAALQTPLIVYAGLCRDFQILEKVPYEKHDLRVQFLISEGGIWPVKAL